MSPGSMPSLVRTARGSTVWLLTETFEKVVGLASGRLMSANIAYRLTSYQCEIAFLSSEARLCLRGGCVWGARGERLAVTAPTQRKNKTTENLSPLASVPLS